MLIPDKFIRHLQNDRVILRSRINSIKAVSNQIAVTVEEIIFNFYNIFKGRYGMEG